jgi:hypothetical protein
LHWQRAWPADVFEPIALLLACWGKNYFEDPAVPRAPSWSLPIRPASRRLTSPPRGAGARAPAADTVRWARLGADAAEGVGAAVRILLDLEPKELIFAAFDINVIRRYFTEFDDALPPIWRA